MRVLLEDPRLRARLNDPQSAKGEALTHLCWVPQERLEPGRWAVDEYLRDDRHVGLLIVDGHVLRELRVFGESSGELLGPGDVIQPAQQFTEAPLPASTLWRILSSTRLAVLDGGFEAIASTNPGLAQEVHDRFVRRAHHMSVLLALARVRNLAQRIHLILAHCSYRWGDRNGDLWNLQAPLSHDVLSKLSGARRPSVSAALGELANRQLVWRRGRDGWCIRAPAEAAVPVSTLTMARSGVSAR
jgi:CRP/FNR family transcriptional regulator, cyclic AMP receptor protein